VYEVTDAVGKLWARFLPRAATIRNAAAPLRFRQLASWTEEGDDDIDIMTGVEVPDFSDLPIDLVGKSVPGCDCLVFTQPRPGHAHRRFVPRHLRAVAARVGPAPGAPVQLRAVPTHPARCLNSFRNRVRWNRVVTGGERGH
jgi:hypothetical protein